MVRKPRDGILDHVGLKLPRLLDRPRGGLVRHLDVKVPAEVDLPHLRIDALIATSAFLPQPQVATIQRRL